MTPQETAELFATLRTFVAAGLAVILITHKLNEVMASPTGNGAARRQGRRPADFRRRRTRTIWPNSWWGVTCSSPCPRPRPTGRPGADDRRTTIQGDTIARSSIVFRWKSAAASSWASPGWMGTASASWRWPSPEPCSPAGAIRVGDRDVTGAAPPEITRRVCGSSPKTARAWA